MISTQAGVDLQSFVSRGESEGYQGRYDPDSTPASMGVIAMLSEIRNRCPTDMKPLQSFIDTDALDEFVGQTGPRAESLSVTFRVADFTVTVYGSGEMIVTPRAPAEFPEAGEGVLSDAS